MQQASKKGNDSGKIKTSHLIKFIVGSIVGMVMFLVPIPRGEPFNIPLGFAIDILGDWLSLESVNISTILAVIFISASAIITVVAHVFKPGFVTRNKKLSSVFITNSFYMVCRILAFILVAMVFLGIGPEFIISGDVGGLMLDLLITGLVPIFLILAFFIPVLTDFGLMEFVGVLIKKAVRFLFTLPGRASIDLAASWFGSSAVSIIITRDQHEKGFYTGREAAAIATNFSFVSLPFSFVVARTLGLQEQFLPWYLIVCITCILLAAITPRIWPLSKLQDVYIEDKGKQIDEDDDNDGVPRFQKAVQLASARAGKTKATDIVFGGLKCYLDVFMDLFPVIMVFGTLGLIVAESTPIFQLISVPMQLFLDLLRVPGAADYAYTTLIGFADMFLPAILLSTEAPEATRFVIGALSIVQIIYMAETGILILKSEIPLGLGRLAIMFLVRTLIGLPIIVLLTRLIMNLDWSMDAVTYGCTIAQNILNCV